MASGNEEIKSDFMSETVKFLDLMFGKCPPDLYVLIWQLAGKESVWGQVSVLKGLARICHFKRGDYYFGVGLSPKDYGPKNRCEADKTAGIVGLWADIDIKGDAHKNEKLPRTVEEARQW